TPFGTHPVLKWTPSSAPLPIIPLPSLSQHYPDSFIHKLLNPPCPLTCISNRVLEAAKNSVIHWQHIRSVAECISEIKDEKIYKPPPDHSLSLDHLNYMYPQVYNEGQANLHLQQYIALLLAHIGFIGCRDSILHIVMDLFLNCLHNIASTLHILADHHLDEEKRLLKALQLNGIDIVGLQDHAILGICRASRRLGELHKRLRNKLKDLTLGGPSAQCLDDLPMDAQDDAFASGNFLSRLLDEDFFGLGDLGLDEKMIPTNLWYRDPENPGYYKLRRVTLDPTSEPSLPVLEEPSPFPPVTRETKVIGVMRPFFEAKWMKYGSQVFTLPEDEMHLSYKAKRARQHEREVHAGLASKKIKKK
ncbi:Transcriptional activator spt7, partial [Coelomomyces lativittatus]